MRTACSLAALLLLCSISGGIVRSASICLACLPACLPVRVFCVMSTSLPSWIYVICNDGGLCLHPVYATPFFFLFPLARGTSLTFSLKFRTKEQPPLVCFLVGGSIGHQKPFVANTSVSSVTSQGCVLPRGSRHHSQAATFLLFTCCWTCWAWLKAVYHPDTQISAAKKKAFLH